MESDEFFKIVTTSVDKTIGEIFLMVLKYSIYNSLSITAIINLFRLVNSFFQEPILPDSRYTTDQLLNQKAGVEFHTICHSCSAYIGKFGEINSVKSCNVCKGKATRR